MAIFAHMDDDVGTVGADRAPRRTLRLPAEGSLVSGAATNVLIHNVSATGLLLESRLPIEIGETITIDLPHAGLTSARVVWKSGALAGCQFDRPVSDATLSAAQLRSATGEDFVMDAAPDGDGASETFGSRLRRLRKERKLTLDQVASHLGVSKPTVWAWEQEKARPVDSRLTELADVLGVPVGELTSSYETPPLLDVIARSKRQIAAVAGIAIGKIRVMIEL